LWEKLAEIVDLDGEMPYKLEYVLLAGGLAID